jgi:hypothetical protein
VYWYTREKGGGSAQLAEELKAVKEREEQLMLEVWPDCMAFTGWETRAENCSVAEHPGC